MSNEDGSSPAFPVLHTIDGNWVKEPIPDFRGMSQRAYSAIHLRVTDPALPEWLNAMIERARRDDVQVTVADDTEYVLAQGRG